MILLVGGFFFSWRFTCVVSVSRTAAAGFRGDEEEVGGGSSRATGSYGDVMRCDGLKPVLVVVCKCR